MENIQSESKAIINDDPFIKGSELELASAVNMNVDVNADVNVNAIYQEQVQNPERVDVDVNVNAIIEEQGQTPERAGVDVNVNAVIEEQGQNNPNIFEDQNQLPQVNIDLNANNNNNYNYNEYQYDQVVENPVNVNIERNEEEEDNSKKCFVETLKIIAYAIAGIGIIFLFPFMLGYSYKTVHPLYMGILVEGNTYRVLSDKLYEGGRYYVGLNNYFVTFPRHNLYVHRIGIDNKTTSLQEETFVRDAITIRTK